MNIGDMARSYDPSALKQDVNLVAVVLDTGVMLEPVDEHRLIGHCPFHADTIESFAVWQWEDTETWACGCFACSPFRDGVAAVGDVFDYLQAFYHVSFRQSIELAVGYLGKELPDVPDMPKDLRPLPDLGKMLQDADPHSGLLQELLHARGVHIPSQWLYDNWRVADGNGEVLIPHFDGAGLITALKHRRPGDGWTSRSVRGSELTHLYGEWRARGGKERPVYLCYADDTEVLTPQGWREFHELASNDQVAQWDVDDSCKWVTPIAHQEFEYSGPMVSFSCDFSDLLVTPDHRVISSTPKKTKPSVRPAQEMVNIRGRTLPVAGYLQQMDSDGPSIEEARVIAMFAGDGGWAVRTSGALFNVKKERKKERIRELLTAIGLTQQSRPGKGNHEKLRGWSEGSGSVTPDWTMFLVHGLEFVRDYLEGDDGKRLSWNILDWSLEVRQAFLQELGYWDGDFPGKTGVRFFTADKQSAEVVSAIASISGWGSILRNDTHKETVTYVVNLVPRNWRGPLFNPPTIVNGYTGSVYCLTVPSGFLITRRNGKVTVSGNCEGESDTWTVSYVFAGDPVDVLGLPSGAAATPKTDWLELVANRDLVLLLDADRAGRESASKWAVMAAGKGARVRVANLPDGTDCTSAGATEVRRAVEEAWPVIRAESLAIYVKDDRYYRRGKDEDSAGLEVSDFVMHPTRLIDLEGSIVYEVEVPGKQHVQLVTDLELSSTDRLRRWCAARTLSWKGTNRDVSDLLELLKAQSILIPRVRGTDVVGLHADVFVMPNESIGSTGFAYVPPENDINLGASINLGGRGWSAELPGLLAELHRVDVVTPILGWVAAAPLRSLIAKFPVLGVTGGSGYGKALALDTPIPTPTGWTTMGELQVGDEVFDNHGAPTKVTYVTGVQQNRSCYLVSFNDGSSITADADHLWEVWKKNTNHKVGGRIQTVIATEDMYKSFEKSRYLVKVTEPLQLTVANLPIDPYILGYWLGDGTTADGTFTCEEADQSSLCKELANAGYEPHVANTDTQRIRTYGLQVDLRETGVLNNKHIPSSYLRGSIEQRLSLLQGLMDSDGYCQKKGYQCEFTSTDSDLFWQVVELARSLGLRPGTGWGWSSINKVRKSFKLRMWFQYPPQFDPFRLERKRHHSPKRPVIDRFVTNIQPVSSVPVKCIQVDSEDHLYLAGEGMVPTHNTTILEVILASFGFWTSQPTTLTGATPHGLQSYVGATNAIPIWIDEYRPGARIEAKLALDQIIRDSWDGSATIKGGLHDNRMKIQKLPARAPLVVTGEDTFSETSHAERMLMIDIPKDGRNSDALVEIRLLKSPAFGRAYLQWLLDQIRTGSLPAPPNVPDRKSQARAIGWWGYQLLDRFCQELCGYELPEYDGTLAKNAHAEIERTPIIVEALIESIDHTFGDGQVVCWREDDDLIVKIQPWCQRARAMGFALPGGSKAVDKWLFEQYHAYKEMDAIHNRVTVVPGIMKGRDDE